MVLVPPYFETATGRGALYPASITESAIRLERLSKSSAPAKGDPHFRRVGPGDIEKSAPCAGEGEL